MKNLLIYCLLASVIITTGIILVIDYESKLFTIKPPVTNIEPLAIDIELLDTSNQIYTYYDEESNIQGLFGIDVSEHQGDIDWERVKNAGVEFAIIRVGYRGYASGKISLDNKFHYNMTEAIKNGINVGVYFFSQAKNTKEALEEANFVLKNIRKYDLSYPIVFDMEDIYDEDHRIMDLSLDERSHLAQVFAGRIIYKGYVPMIYLNLNWTYNHYDLNRISNYDIWFAQYNDYPEYPYDFQIWQYSDNGSIDGINEPVDLNIYFRKNKESDKYEK